MKTKKYRILIITEDRIGRTEDIVIALHPNCKIPNNIYELQEMLEYYKNFGKYREKQLNYTGLTRHQYYKIRNYLDLIYHKFYNCSHYTYILTLP